MERFTTINTRDNPQIGDVGIRPLGELKVLKKQPLKNYFEGTRERKEKKRKVRVKKTKWSIQLPQAQTEETWSSPWGNFQKKENKEPVDSKYIELKIYKNMKNSEYNKRKNYMKQRAAEESYLEEQINLAETWMGVLKRSQQLKQRTSEGESNPKPVYKELYSGRIGISIISRRIWPDDEDPIFEKSKKDTSEQQKQSTELGKNAAKPSDSAQNGCVVDKLSEEFLQQLVFVDDED